MVERQGFEDLVCEVKRVSITLVRKGTKKKKRKKHIFTCMPVNKAMAVGLARIEGQGTVERWGFEDPTCGEKRSATLVRKEMKKEEKKHIFTYVPENEEMVAAGLVRLEGQHTVERWGFEDWEKRSLQWSEKKQKKEEKKKT